VSESAPAPVPGAPVTMHEVARAAGVSPQTVSRVVDDSPAVRAATRRHVLEVIAHLGYQRDDAASRLARRPRRPASRPAAGGTSSGR
jgi:DNA-binding LacI/PurR family transcriptional regulator